MTDQTIPDVTDDERRLARKWAEDIVTGLSNPRMRAAARVILDAVPAPPRPTLADMTLDERDECTGMQADLAQGDRVVILDGTPDHDGFVQVLERSLDVYRPSPADVTPRPDLPRLEWPGDKKPATTLPDGWRLADHLEYGRGIVTTQTPNRDGNIYFVTPSDWLLGYDCHPCRPAELTYLEQGADQ